MALEKGTIEKERVVCQNCRYHYSYLYDAKTPSPQSRPTLKGNLKNYFNPRECYRSCPHCGFFQDWMIAAQRKHYSLDLLLVILVGASAVLLYLGYRMATVAIDPLGSGTYASFIQPSQIVILGYLGLVAVVSLCCNLFLKYFWNPNRTIDTGSYEAALPQDDLSK